MKMWNRCQKNIDQLERLIYFTCKKIDFVYDTLEGMNGLQNPSKEQFDVVADALHLYKLAVFYEKKVAEDYREGAN